MIKPIAILLFSWWVCTVSVQAQTVFSKLYNYSGRDGEISLSVEITDNGYVIAGTGYTPYDSSVWRSSNIVITDKGGNAQQYSTVSREGIGYNSSGNGALISTSDGGFALSGARIIPDTTLDKWDFLFIKYNAAGDTQFVRTYDLRDGDHGRQIRQLPDGSYIITGDSWLGNNRDIHLLHIDSVGNLLWDTTYGGWGGRYRFLP